VEQPPFSTGFYNNCKVLGLTVDSEATLTGYSKFLVIFTLYIFFVCLLYFNYAKFLTFKARGT